MKAVTTQKILCYWKTLVCDYHFLSLPLILYLLVFHRNIINKRGHLANGDVTGSNGEALVET